MKNFIKSSVVYNLISASIINGSMGYIYLQNKDNQLVQAVLTATLIYGIVSVCCVGVVELLSKLKIL
jgi:ABC-type nitrate/sulfonate/bicarbonate transport system permease component